MFTDIVGYTALSQQNESESLELLERHRQLLRPLFSKHAGQEIKTVGDAFLVEFASALEATLCAVDIQSTIHSRNLERGEKLQVRVGVHVGDVMHEGGDILGDAVNVASRIEPLAEPGGICVSEQVQNHVKNKIPYPLVRLEVKELKNVKEPLTVYKVVLPWEAKGTEAGAPPQLDRRRVAVLPFVNISPDPNDSYFADGLTEELISALSEVRGLRVIARTSVNHYKDAAKSASQIGAELKVSHLLEGSVRKAENRIRIATHLIDTESQEEVWSARYEKDLVDVLSIQSDIAANVAEALKVRLLATEKDRIESKETESVAAYVAYLKGRSLLREGIEESAHLAREQFELAIREDENYAKAYAGMADTMTLLGDYLFSPVPVALEGANRYVRRALALDPNLAEARVSLANLLMYDYRFEEAETNFRMGIEANPSYATGHHWYSICLQCFGHIEEGLHQALLAEELDPLSASIALTVVYRLLNLGRFEEAMKRIRKLEEIERGSPLVDEALMVCNFIRGDWEATEAILKRMSERDPMDPYLDMDLAYMYAVTGRRDEALKLVEKLKKVPEDLRIRGQLVAFAYLGLGDLDATFEWLNYAFSKKEFFFSWIRGHPAFEPIRKDNRYRDLLKAANLPLD